VFKASNIKPLKITSKFGKEENAPWREWFSKAVEKGVHVQLPEDILKQALQRYPMTMHNGIFLVVLTISYLTYL
jgi:hypothetical protein